MEKYKGGEDTRCFFSASAIVINIIDRNENFNEQGEVGCRHGPTGNKLRYTASRNHYVISTSFVQPYHVYPSVHACAPACMCTCVANPIEWNVYKHPLSLGQSFSLFHVFTPPNNGVKTQRISRRSKLRQGIIKQK